MKISADTTMAIQQAEEATALFAESLELPLEIAKRLINLLEAGPEFRSIKADTAGRADNLCVQLSLPKGFVNLVAALRARKAENSSAVV
jgi:hypothetical protein